MYVVISRGSYRKRIFLHSRSLITCCSLVYMETLYYFGFQFVAMTMRAIISTKSKVLTVVRYFESEYNRKNKMVKFALAQYQGELTPVSPCYCKFAFFMPRLWLHLHFTDVISR